MARTGTYLRVVPDGWCYRQPERFADRSGRGKAGAGIRATDAHPDSFKRVFYKKWLPYDPSSGEAKDFRQAKLGVVYACPRRLWKPGKKKGTGRCYNPAGEGKKSGLRVVFIMKPYQRYKKSKHKGMYKCKPGR